MHYLICAGQRVHGEQIPELTALSLPKSFAQEGPSP